MLDGVAVGVADGLLAGVGEDGCEARFAAVPVQAFAEGGDGVVRQVEQWGADVGVDVEQIAADFFEVGEGAQVEGAGVMPDPEEPAQVLDLVAALNASVAKVRESRGEPTGEAEVHELAKPTKKTAAKKTATKQPAKKTAAKKTTAKKTTARKTTAKKTGGRKPLSA